ncbi:O-methyltransferase family 2 [Penicillium expansum]|nr:O-methyltransferase family 2 [Penicillium expansum]
MAACQRCPCLSYIFNRHNWSDDVCEIILARVKEAMKPGYSRLLINENVVPNTGVHWETTGPYVDASPILF